jgi:hypothetical protein
VHWLIFDRECISHDANTSHDADTSHDTIIKL